MWQDLSVAQQGGSHHLDSGWLEAKTTGSSFKNMQLYTVLRGCKHKPHKSQAIWRCPLGSSCKIMAPDMYKLLSGRHQRAGARQKESAKLASTDYVPWEQLCRPLMCAQPEACPSVWSSGTTQVASFIERWGLCLSLLCSVLGIVACQELSLLLPWSHGTKEHKPLWPPEASDQGVSPGHQLQKPAPGACKAFLWETLVLWSIAEAEHKDPACPLGEDYS